MAEPIDSEFLKLINENLGIAHKVCNIYFDDAETRQDVIQDMMYQLWKSFKSFGGHAKFSTWMYSVCLNTALTSHKRTRSKLNEPLGSHHDNIPEQGIGSRDDDIKLLYQAIATLSPLNKAIVLLYLEDLPYEEISAITGLTKANVSVRLVRLKKELETYMKKQSNI